MSGGVGERKPLMSRILSVQNFAGEHVDADWPVWLSLVAAEAIKGWVPRRADSFEKLDQVSFKISLLHAPFYFKNKVQTGGRFRRDNTLKLHDIRMVKLTQYIDFPCHESDTFWFCT